MVFFKPLFRRRPKPSRLAALLLAALLVGCFPPRVPSVVKVGLVAPFEGRHRAVGYDAVYAARLAIREIDGAGGIGDWRLELVAYDDRGDPELAARIAENLVIDPDVLIVIGHYRPETIAAAAPIYAAAELSFIVLGGWGPPAPSTWNLMPPPETLAWAMMTAGAEACPDAESLALWDGGPAAETLAAELDSALSSADYDDEVDIVLSLLPPVASAERLVDWRAAGWRGEIVGAWDLAHPGFEAVAGQAGLGSYFVTPYPFPQDLEGIGPWIAAYEDLGPHVPTPGPYALPTYDAVYLVAEAVVAAVQEGVVPDRAVMVSELGQVHRSGVLGVILWDEHHHWERPPLYAYRWTATGPECLACDADGAP